MFGAHHMLSAYIVTRGHAAPIPATEARTVEACAVRVAAYAASHFSNPDTRADFMRRAVARREA